MADFSNWQADEPGVTPMWWRGNQSHFPRHVEAEFNEFLLVLDFYCGREPSHDNMDRVLNAVAKLKSALANTRTKTLVPKLIAVRTGNECPNLVRALDNLVNVLNPRVNPVPKAYRI